ncbi:hypothetical protein [Alkalihalophilus marmarensis]|uniref:Lipoprotein n=1 Tax=Alkalihalophilus marmarensis DSM 21297 TaxID=1188261 RepID=U6SUL7_9BACI|nr:hypothetical protein [Alkalihalophilus marmarensis]ERN54331.1 hypothetical protein A33I_07895 [Alkalihalophilus marmarensis DSM 21297]
MKKIFYSLFILLICLILISCSSSTNGKSTNDELNDIVQAENNSSPEKNRDDEILYRFEVLSNQDDLTLYFENFPRQYDDIQDNQNKKSAKNQYLSLIEKIIDDKEFEYLNTLKDEGILFNSVLSDSRFDDIDELIKVGLEDTMKHSKQSGVDNMREEAEKMLPLIKSAFDKQEYDLIDDYTQHLDDFTIETMNNYREALIDLIPYENGETSIKARRNVLLIDPDYNGILSDEIQAFAAKYTTVEEREEAVKKHAWHKERVEENRKLRAIEKSKNAKPRIGMTKEEVKNTDWGKPQKINRTTTAYGVREQWVYPNYKYVYLEDGIVTAIQD